MSANSNVDAQSSSLVDYDTDDDRLIEISNLEQLDAVRYDLNGDGISDLMPGREAFSHAFPSPLPEFGCPGAGCAGYELTRELDFNDLDSYASELVNGGWSKEEGGEGWLPIGTYSNEFGATFEGNGHTIANLYIVTHIGYVGLFGAMNDDGTIRNLGLVEVDVSGGESYVGPLVGSNSGTVIRCYATGSVSGDSTVGGLVGGNSNRYGRILDSYATSTVSAKGSAGGLAGGNWYRITGSHATGDVSGGGSVGGLVGWNAGPIGTSYATGNVSGRSAGGLVGNNNLRGMVISSYATGAVVGGSSTGGLVGVNYDTIRGSYATGDVSGYDGGGLVGSHSGTIVSSYATGAVSGRYQNGGMVGDMHAGSVVFGSYSTGHVSGQRRFGGLAGWNDNPRGILSSYWNIESSGQEFGVEGRYISGAEGKSTADLQTPTAYTGIYLDWNRDIDNADGDNNEVTDTDDPWDFGREDEYPVLRADFDGDGEATWEEFGTQTRTAPPPDMEDPPTPDIPEAPAVEPSPLCMNGIVVQDPQNNPGLVGDCTILLQGRDTLAGNATLNWSHEIPINRWHGISLEWSPPRVVELALNSRRLTGRVPPEFGKLSALEVLRLRINGLTGGIPPELGGLSRLRSLDLHSNSLGGAMPPELGNLSNLEGLNLDATGLWGAIPPELGKLSSLTHLNLGQNRLTGSIPKELSNLKNLTLLQIYKNNLTGPIPPEISKLSSLGILIAWSNGLTGSIPPELGDLPNLFWLSLGHNALSGPITPELANLTNLSIIDLRNNQLTGEIPDWFSGLPKLQEVYLSNNQLSGSIPAEISKLSTLTRLYLNNNKLTGTIPGDLGGLTALTQFSISSNQLTGNIPLEIGNLRRLTELYLSNNNLSGSIPGDMGKLSALRLLLLNNNRLSGSIPVELSNLTKLETLYLQDNDLTGSIPTELASLSELRVLNLSGNRLSGCVPRPLGGRLTLQLTHDMLPKCLPPVEEGSVVTIRASDLHGADPLTIVTVGDAINGTVSFEGNTITYTHDGSETIAGGFSYTVSDGTNTYDATASVTVTPVNDPPVATDDALTVDEGEVRTFRTAALLDNDSDAEGDALVIVEAGDSINGRVSLDGTTITFEHDGSETTSGRFSYTVGDGLETDVATVRVSVTPVNDPPIATADTLTIDEGEVRTLMSAALLDNDADAEGDGLIVVEVGDAVNGSVSLDGTTITYEHDGLETTTGRFTYTVSDGTETDSAVVEIEVFPVNDPPMGISDADRVTEGDVVSLPVSTLIKNDVDAENDDLRITSVGEALNGAVWLEGTTVTYRHDGSETTRGGFTYTVSDGIASDGVSVSITVIPSNDPPTGAMDALAIEEGGSITVPAASLLNNDSDAEGDRLTVTSVTGAINGTARLQGISITYEHDGSETTTGGFTYTLTDGAFTTTADVTVSVSPVNDAPVGDRDSLTVDEGGAVTVETLTLLANDTDAENDTLTIVAVGDPVNGMVFLDGTTIIYEHDDSDTLTGRFSYTVFDGAGADSTTVEITVTPIDDAPAATEEEATVSPATPAAEVTGNPTAVPDTGTTVSATPLVVATPSTPQDAAPDVSVPSTDDGGFSIGMIVLIIAVAVAISGIAIIIMTWRRMRT